MTTVDGIVETMSDYQLANRLDYRMERIGMRPPSSRLEIFRGLIEPDRFFADVVHVWSDQVKTEAEDLLHEFYKRVISAGIERYGVEILPVKLQPSEAQGMERS